MYNRIQVLEAIKQVQNVNITVTKKSLHYAKLEEIRNILHGLMSINNALFEPDYFYSFYEYKKAIEASASKKELDKKLNYCKVEIISQLTKIIDLINNSIWDNEKQKYIEIA